MTIAFVIILAVMVIWAISAFNRLIALKGQTLNGWKQIDVQLKRRHDLIPNLVNAVRGAMEFEKETLDAVISARNQAVKIQADTLPTGGVKALAQAEATLTSALSRLNVVVERYPELKATANGAPRPVRNSSGVDSPRTMISPRSIGVASAAATLESLLDVVPTWESWWRLGM